MPGSEWLFDGALGALLLILAAASLHARSLYAGIVLFITFGLMLALTWARLGAPDLALAEAAIGAGLTGALLLAALARIGQDPAAGPHPRERLPSLLFGLMILVLLVQAVWPLPQGPTPVPALAGEAMADSGVGHPVTAVLLNFRAWDTLLELLVLLLAFLGSRQLVTKNATVLAPWPLLLAWTRLLAPLAVLLGGYLLWRGTSGPGGAFQAGALLAAGAVILRLNRLLPPLRWSAWPLRLLVLVGVVLFLAVAAATAWLGQGWLVYPPAWSGPLILLIEIGATASIAATLTLLVVGEREELRP